MTSFVAPATIANQLDEEITEMFGGLTKYLDRNGLVFTRFNDRLDKLGKADARARSILLVPMYVAVGDRENAEYYLNNAEKLHTNWVELDLARLTLLLNLGYFSEAIDVLKRLSDPGAGQATLLLSKMPGPAVHVLAKLLDTADKMKLVNVPQAASIYPDAARIMDLWGDSDEDYAAALDIAGEILRERHLFYAGQMIATPVAQPADGGDPYVKFVLQVDVDVATSIDMTCDYVDRLAHSGHKIPQSLSFEFESVEA